MTCEICGGMVEQRGMTRRLTCSEQCESLLRSQRKRVRKRVIERPICPVCGCVREYQPGETPAAFYRRQTCGRKACVDRWRAVKVGMAAQARRDQQQVRVVVPMVEETFSYQQRYWLLLRRLRGALGVGLAEGFVV